MGINYEWIVGEVIFKTTDGGGIVSVSNSRDTRAAVPREMELCQNCPNPFNPATVINYRLSASGFVTLRVFDVLGRVVATLVDEKQCEGVHQAIWDARNISSGLYFCRLTVGPFSDTKKMILIR